MPKAQVVTISNYLYSNIFLQIGSDDKSVVGGKESGGKNQQWTIEGSSDGSGTVIKSAVGNYYLGVDGAPGAGEAIAVTTCPHYWYVQKVSEGGSTTDRIILYYLDKSTGLILTAPEGVEGENIILDESTGGNNQQWHVKTVGFR